MTPPTSKQLSLADVARILGVSEKRVYQMDAELKPELIPRGTKMKTRRYLAERVYAVLEARAAR